MADMSAWEVLGVPKEVQRGLSEQSFTTPTPIETLSLPPARWYPTTGTSLVQQKQ